MSNKSRSKKIVRWVLIIFMLITIIGVGVILNRVNVTQQKLSDFISAHPQETAVVTYTFDDHGDIVEDGNAIFHNPDEPLVVASVMKTAVLAAYADMVVNDELDPDERVPVADWERFYLPFTDGGAHQLGLQSLGLQTDELGFATDPTATVTLDEMATIMMHYSGNAATDYLIERIGLERVTAVTQTHLPQHTPIHYKLGFTLAIFNHEIPYSTAELQQVSAHIESGDYSDIERLIDLYLHNETWRRDQIDYLSGVEPVSADLGAYHTAAAQLLPQGTAREYARMMAQIGSGRFISPQVSAIMQQKMESVPSDWPLRALYFERFAAKDGMTAGVLAVASYAAPKWGSLRHQSRVVVLIVNNMPVEQFAEQANFQGHYLLPIDLALGNGSFALP